MSHQRRVAAADLYQADLERHLFALDHKPGLTWHARIGAVVAALRERWMGGWTRLATAEADPTFFL
jgi:hypothetical protein